MDKLVGACAMILIHINSQLTDENPGSKRALIEQWLPDFSQWRSKKSSREILKFENVALAVAAPLLQNMFDIKNLSSFSW